VNRSVCVVIPYFQRSTEPLHRAIRSVMAQRELPAPHILIIDDGSPLPAKVVIEEHFKGEALDYTIIEVGNGGPAKARNIGLDNLPKHARYVAFLDSDDEWTPSHLSNALYMLEHGSDVYFADYQRKDWPASRFTQMKLELGRHRCIDDERGLYQYAGNALVQLMATQLIKTSTVVMNRDLVDTIRFPEELTVGEDDIFWGCAIERARCCGFSTSLGVTMGEGVNISQGGQWGDQRSCELMMLNMRKWKRIFNYLPTIDALRALRDREIDHLREMFCRTLLFRLRRRMDLPWRTILAFTREDPIWPLWFSVTAYRTLRNRSNA